jgi:hypothetical protein
VRGSLHLGARHYAAIAAKLDAAPFRCGKSFLGAIGDHASLKLGDRDHLLQHEPAGGALDLRQIGESDVDAGFQ